MGEVEAKRVLAAADVAVPDGGEASDLDGCLAIADRVGWPVALKLSGPSIQHKAAVGALALNLGSAGELADAVKRLATLPEAVHASFLVERMAEPGVEAFVAARAAGVVPALVIGLGGALAEALNDVAIVPLPADRDRTIQAIASLRGAAVLADATEALATTAVQIGELLVEANLALIELNPVTVRDGRCVALDAVARR
jgi:succinyl-CoA synthetase beta subunit